MSNQWPHQELQIPILYGAIAAKAWGNKCSEPVLALHGWQDNAGTFDRLIPLLTSDLYIVAIDCPGHGQSSHKPFGTFYHYMEMLVDIQRVVDFLKWERFSIIGHSLGGTLALMYCSVYPESVKNVVLLDVIKPGSRETEKLPYITRSGISSLLEIEQKVANPTPVYKFEEAKKRLMSGLYDEVTSEAADILLVRGCQPSKCGKGVIFSRDIRIKMTEDLFKLSHDDLKAYMNRIQCNLMIIRAKSSYVVKMFDPKLLEDFINIYKNKCKSFQIIDVEGNHFVHLNNPENVSLHIDNFFQKHEKESSKI